MSDLVIRKPTESDAAAIASICNAVTQELYGTGDASETEVRGWFSMPDLTMLLAERDGRTVGYMDVRRDREGTRFPVDVRVAPGLGRGDVAASLLEAAEESARKNAEPGAQARGMAPERDRELAETLERAGYRLIRHSFHMLIEPLEDIQTPEWPDGITVRTYDSERDEQRVYEGTEEAFEDHWDFHRMPFELWRKFMLERPTFDHELWWLAEEGDQLAGVCLNDWHFSGEPGFGWIGTLAVRRPWRRRGLGLALLRQSFLDFKQRGATKVGLGVDAENTTGAVRLYERAGMRPVRRNDIYEKELTPRG